jgi:hypothetical protein
MLQIPFELKDETIYLIAPDDLNYAFARKRERTRNGITETEFIQYKWFSDINSALVRIMDLKVKRSDAKSLQELRLVIEQARKEVMEVWQIKK